MLPLEPPDVERLKAEGDIQGLINAVGHVRDYEVRKTAEKALGEISDPNAVEPLIAALKDKNSNVRATVAEALGKIGDPRAVEPLIAALKDEAERPRIFAAGALGEIGDSRAVEPLIAALKDKEKYVRTKAADALGEIGDPRAVEPLTAFIATLKDKQSYEHIVVTRVLSNFSDRVVLTVNDDGTVTDMRTGLIWQRAEDGAKRNYDEALSYCASLELAGRNDWRLPSKEELLELASVTFEMLKKSFPNIKAERYWAHTTADQLRWAEAPERIAYTVDFDPESGNYRQPITYFRTYSYYVRAVRND